MMSFRNSNQVLQAISSIRVKRTLARRQPQIDSRPQLPKFRGDNLAIQSFRGPEWILSGPSETGKTFACLWLLDSLLRSTPYAKATLARKVQATIYSTVLLTWERILELQLKLGGEKIEVIGGQQPKLYIYPNGARLWVGGLDYANKILSGERDFIYINQAEELEHKEPVGDWETLITRTTGRGAVTSTPMLFGDCNPGAGDHWIIKRETLRLFKSKHEDNPSLFDDAGNLTPQGVKSMRTLDSLTGIRKKRLRYGLWVGAEGIFFEEFDEDLHVVDPFKVPDDWPIWGALDYGFGHPTAIGLFTQSNDGVIYLIAEHVKNKLLPPFHCKGIRRQAELRGIDWRRVRTVFAGHDVMQERGASDGRTIEDQYREARDPENGKPIGFKVTPANVARIFGAQELLTRFGNREMMIAPTLKIFNTCPRTIACLQRIVTDPNDPEDAKKIGADAFGEGGDDEYDMLRYGVASILPRKAGSGRAIGLG